MSSTGGSGYAEEVYGWPIQWTARIPSVHWMPTLAAASVAFRVPLFLVILLVFVAFGLSGQQLHAAEPAKLAVLFLGDQGHHRPADMAKILTPAMAKVGVRIDYTGDVSALTAENLAKYDALAIFRDSGDLPPQQEATLIEFIQSGKGLVAIHCASHCFRNSDRYTALVGGRFLRHGGEVFRARIIDAQHPAMRGLKSFESWDETYVHDQLASDIRVLMVREEKGGYEPYTWVRDEGKGRVFYTALGHDEHTWKQPGFHRLLEQATRWAAHKETTTVPLGSAPRRSPTADTPVPPEPPKSGTTNLADSQLKPLQYVEANIPNYLPGKAWGTTGEPIRKMQLPLSPAESMKHMHLPEGFEVQLFAAEPDIVRPIAMAWDARGRLWIAESVDYPNDMQPPGQGHDRIKICEDTDGDGRADKFTVFADKLSIPTSLAFANGGVIVAQAPDMVFLQSTKGDDKADVRRILFSGWGISDTHSGPSNLRWGFDNWLWGTVGYSGFRGRVGNQEHRFGQGIFRMRPDGSQLEFLSSTTNNIWGLGLNETGQVFASTANNQHSVFLALPNRHYESVRGWHGQGSTSIEDHKKIHPITPDVRQVDFHGGFTAAAGHALYTARSFPPEYWNRAAFVCEPTGHLVHIDWLDQQGSGFVARDGWNILASDDAWTAPIAAEVGPDGALWVIDWYNFIVQHNPTPAGFQTGKGGAYVTPLRDKTHGRIYRIVYKGTKPGPRPRLDQAEPKELVATLRHENMWWRQTAQRLLVERGQSDVLPLLSEIVHDGKSGPAAIHALWTMHGLGAFAAKPGAQGAGLGGWMTTAKAGLTHPDAGVRRAALAILPRGRVSVTMILAAKSLFDDDAQVRLAALLTLSEMPGSGQAADAIAAMLEESRNATDRWIPSGAVCAAARSDLDFLQGVAATRPKKEEEKPLREVVRAVAEHLARRAPAPAPGKLVNTLTVANPVMAEAMLTGLAAGWPASRPAGFDDQLRSQLTALATKLSPQGLLQLTSLLKKWGLREEVEGLSVGLRKGLQSRLADQTLAEEARLAAARDLITLGGDKDGLEPMLEQITPKAAPSLIQGLLDAVGQATSDEIGPALLERWPALTPAARNTALSVLLRRPAWTKAMLAGLEKGQIDKSDLSIDQVQQLSRHPDPTIAAKAKTLLAKGGRLPSPDRQKVLDALLPLAKRHGDAAKGKQVFEKNCAKCHRFGAIGQTVGPDLTGIAVRDRADILTDILDPNRSVEGNYRQYTVETKNGLFLTGLLTAETKTVVELLDSEAQKRVIQRDDIESIVSSPLSLMPEGFEKLPEGELASLLDFLTARDKYFPLPLGKVATITSVRGMFYSRDSDVERLIFSAWGPHTAFGVPFQLIDPRGGSIPNVILLYGPQGAVSKEMPKSARVPCHAAAKTIHLLSGVSGWGYPLGKKGSVSMIVRLHYEGGESEDHPLLNGVHFADYIRVVDVPESQLAFRLRGQQVRYLAVKPKRNAKIEEIEFVKGPDETAPIVMAATVESPE